MAKPRKNEGQTPRPRDEAAERYLDLWDRNQSEIARQGPPSPPTRPG